MITSQIGDPQAVLKPPLHAVLINVDGKRGCPVSTETGNVEEYVKNYNSYIEKHPVELDINNREITDDYLYMHLSALFRNDFLYAGHEKVFLNPEDNSMTADMGRFIDIKHVKDPEKFEKYYMVFNNDGCLVSEDRVKYKIALKYEKEHEKLFYMEFSADKRGRISMFMEDVSTAQ